ncbi:MAG: tagatose 1,6-diphosphate aldolase [Anaerolineae bacterium]|nr:tagatose 1,6-diphosphate aldolase [Anaerolineae bacterium]
MVNTLTPGRWIGLKRTSADGDIFTILAFDQRGTYRKMLPKDTSYDTAVAVKREIVTALSPDASAVLLDADYGLASAQFMSRHSGLLLAIENSGYTGDATYRGVDFDPEWTVGKIKNMGGNAVKLLTYYHPDTGALAEEIEGVIKQVVQQCHKHDLPLFLEPLSYSLKADVAKESAAFAPTRPQAVIETARRLSKTGVDVLKMEFPYDAAFHTDQKEWRKACEAISEASSVPWVLLSAGVDFDVFATQTQIACEAGASGFLAGRAIWKEAVTMSDEERAKFLTDVAMPRMRNLSEIALKYAQPWTKYYSPLPATSGWHKNYQEL